MKLFREAPCLSLLLSLVISILLTGKGFPFWLSGIVSGFIFLGLGFCAYDGTPNSSYIFILCFVVSMFGSLWSSYRVETDLFLSGRLAEKAVVAFERPWGGKRAVVFKTPKGKFVGFTSPSLALKEGDSVGIKASVLPIERRNIGFNPYTYWRSRGVVGRLVGLQVKKSRKSSPLSVFRWRSSLKEWILLNYPPRIRGYLLAMLLGVRDPELVKLHSSWGTSHLLAVSGFHVALLVGVIFSTLRGSRLKVQISILFLFVYLVFTGFAASATRAGLMVTFALIGKLIGRPIKLLQAVSLAAISLILWRPWFVWDIGWKLSVMSALTIGCMDIFPKKFLPFILSSLLWVVNAGCVLATFGTLPLAGLVINPIAIPTFGILFLTVILFAPFAFLPFEMGRPFLFLTEGVLVAVERVLNLISSLMPATFTEVWPWPFISLGIFFIILAKRLNFNNFRNFCLSCCGLFVYILLLS